MKKYILSGLFCLSLVVSFLVLAKNDDAISAETMEKKTKWHLVGGLSEGPYSPFIEISSDSLKDRSVYDGAVSAVCRDHNPCFVAFFAVGDKIPQSQESSKFFGDGGWKNYKAIAYWSNDSYTVWDCERAGADGAPLSSLCGPFVHDAYRAILSVANRATMAHFCGWAENNSLTFAKQYIQNIKNLPRRAQFQRALDETISQSYGGSPANCVSLRGMVEHDVEDAVKLLREHQI